MGVRNYPDTPRFYIDMDGPLADFDGMSKKLNIEPAMLKRMAGLYAMLPVTSGAQTAVTKLHRMGYQVFALTKIPRANPYAATEKLLWINENFPLIGENVIISPDKGCVGTERDFLVDDHPEWANADNFYGTILTFTWNWPEILQRAMVAKGIEVCFDCNGTDVTIVGDGHGTCPSCLNGFIRKTAHA